MNGSQNLTFTDSTVTVVRQGPDDINSVMLKEKFWTPRLWTRKLIFLGVPILHPNLPEVRSHLFLHHFLIYLSRRSAASSSPWIFSLASVDEPFNSSLHRCFAELGSHLELVSHTWWGWFDLTFCMTWDFCWCLLFFFLFFSERYMSAMAVRGRHVRMQSQARIRDFRAEKSPTGVFWLDFFGLNTWC